MKLQCQVEVINRLHNSLNIRSNGKYLKSTLALGQEPKSDGDYFIIHFSSVNKTGIKYRVKSLRKVFVTCINQGKATIRFEDPPHDLCIKSEVIQLKGFLKLLKSCITGDSKALKVSSLSNLSVTLKDNAPRKLMVKDRSELPNRGLPRTLETLHINGLKLSNFRRDILMCRLLSVLDLSNNQIELLPPELGDMPNLTELNLANNMLGSNPKMDWRWLLGNQITKTLSLLDLRENHITQLPNEIGKLERLVTLKIDDNKLSKLPAGLGRISTLRYLTISKNDIKNLPCSLMQCRLEYIDMTYNNFGVREEDTLTRNQNHWEFYIGDLVNLAAKIVLKNKCFYAPDIIPWTLVEFLNNANMCVCGCPVLNDKFYIREFESKDFFRTVVFNNNLSSIIDFECYFCSPKCFR